MASGGKRKPDGRPPVSPGVGKTAKRHDLEGPKTPGLMDSDLQYGDVKQLEQAQQAVPTRKGPTAPSTTSAPRRKSTAKGEVPDPIEFIGGRSDASTSALDPNKGTIPLVDARPWMPLVKRVATTPGAGGAVGAALVRLLTNQRRMPAGPTVTVIDRQELDAELMGV